MTRDPILEADLLALDLRAQQEWDEREAARKKLAPLIEATSAWKCEKWQIPLYERMEKIPFQTGVRLSIKGPPQTGKTSGGQRLPALYLGNNPTARVRVLTHNETHSVDQYGMVLRQVMMSDYYRGMYPALRGWRPDNGRLQSWSTPQRFALNDGQASFAALGVQTGTIGSGSELYIFDDIYASKEDAFSSRTNEKMRDVYRENIMPRLSPTDNVISLSHPWNEQDFTTFLVTDCGFEEIRIPSICDSENDFVGRPYIEKASRITYEEYVTLSEEEKRYLEQASLTVRQPLEHLLKLRDGYRSEDGRMVAGIGTAAFESLHQGNPKPRGGSRFRLEDFIPCDDYSREPDGLFFSYWDLAGSENPKRDRTVNFVLHKTPGGIYSFIDCTWCRLREEKRNQFIHNTEQSNHEKYGKHFQLFPFVEWQMGIGTDITSPIIRACAEFGMDDDRVTRPLTERCIPLSVQMQAGNVRWKKAEWNQVVQDEFLSYRGGGEAHDDFVSCASGAFNVAVKHVML